MMFSNDDLILLEFVDRLLRTGATRIAIPMSLVQSASKEGVEEVRRLCKLAGVEIEGIFQD